MVPFVPDRDLPNSLVRISTEKPWCRSVNVSSSATFRTFWDRFICAGRLSERISWLGTAPASRCPQAPGGAVLTRCATSQQMAITLLRQPSGAREVAFKRQPRAVGLGVWVDAQHDPRQNLRYRRRAVGGR
jgi:hypothetical protein